MSFARDPQYRYSQVRFSLVLPIHSRRWGPAANPAQGKPVDTLPKNGELGWVFCEIL